MPDQGEVYLTTEQLAERLQVSVVTLYRWAAAGDGPPRLRMGARQVRYRLSDVDVWAQSQAEAS